MEETLTDIMENFRANEQKHSNIITWERFNLIHETINGKFNTEEKMYIL